MLDRFHWQKEEEAFLGLMESAALTVGEIRELTWSQIKESYRGILILERSVELREPLLEEFRRMLREETGLYGELFKEADASGRVFTKETLKSISRELDQFQDV